jgi:uncharacterized protein with PIN domain
MLAGMATAYFRFYEELNDFLPASRRKVEFAHCFDRRASVKDMIESLGVPHPEIDLILVNGRSVGFDHIVADADRISVYPVFESLDIAPLQRLRPQPLREPRFVVDCNLGRLARYLRLLGLDCLYRNDFSDDEVAATSLAQRRIVLTRDRRLLQRKIISHGLFVRAVRPREQAREVLARLDLHRSLNPFSRCTVCNGLLQPVAKKCIESRLEPKTRRYYEDFLQCPECNKLYWQGGHHRRACALVDELTTTPARKEC